MISPRDKTSQALLFLERIFLFLDLDCQNLATLDFDNRPISENENSLAEKKLCLRVFLPLSNHFPAIGNYYSAGTRNGSFSALEEKKDNVFHSKML